MSDKRRGLGRGLGALIPQAPTGERPIDVFFRDQPGSVDAPAGAEVSEGPEAPLPTGGLDAALVASVTNDPVTPEPTQATDLQEVPGALFAEIPLGEICPNGKQPRTVFDPDDMSELVHSIRELGVLQPIVVRPLPEPDPQQPGVRYELIMGERRWRASREAGKATVPAIVRVTEDEEMLRHALLENLHRSQLNPLEEAAAYQQLLEDFGCTHDELASRLGRSRPQISNTMRLLKLPPIVQRRVAAGVLSAGHARALLGLDDAAAMERLAQRIVAEGLSVRSVEEIVALGMAADKPVRAKRAAGRAPELDDISARLADRFETRVTIAMGQRKGKMTVEFASVEDLHRILGAMGAGD